MPARLTPAQPIPEVSGKEVAQAGTPGKSPSLAAKERQRALTARLMEQVCEPDNLNRAYARVLANKGSPGIDGMSVNKLGDWIRRHRQSFIASLLDGSYQPQPVRGVQIPKPGGKGMRQLGIPTVIDRLVQQAMLQALETILDPTFSTSSYGFRPGRGAHDALAAARQYVAEGRTVVVDIDLEKLVLRESQWV
jgi:RNA-directed DNA polymerase